MNVDVTRTKDDDDDDDRHHPRRRKKYLWTPEQSIPSRTLRHRRAAESQRRALNLEFESHYDLDADCGEGEGGTRNEENFNNAVELDNGLGNPEVDNNNNADTDNDIYPLQAHAADNCDNDDDDDDDDSSGSREDMSQESDGNDSQGGDADGSGSGAGDSEELEYTDDSNGGEEQDSHDSDEDDDSDSLGSDNEEMETDTDSSSSDEEPEEQINDYDIGDLERPIAPDSNITLGQFITLVLGYSLRHASTKAALRDMLKLLRTIVGGETEMPRSTYFFEKYFQSIKGVIECIYFCVHCYNNLGKKPPETCTKCGTKKKRTRRRQDGDFFICIPMKNQIRKLLEQPEIAEKLEYRFTRVKKHPDNIEDIYDGNIYRNRPELNNPLNISITWNTDGVSVSKSSTFAIWPIQFIINELPSDMRRKLKHISLAGIWFGNSKPHTELFYDNFVNQCNDLSHRGLKWRRPDGVVVKTRVYALCCTCDSPARSLIMNHKQYNGFYGCNWCLHPGKRVPKGRGSATVYPHEGDAPSPVRTVEQTIECAEATVELGEPVLGVKGPSIIMLIDGMEFIKGQAVDYLHAHLLGVTKFTLELWLKNKNCAYYIQPSQRKLVDKRLLDIQPPNNCPRTPRALHTRKYWKAKEYMCWVLYYSLPCLVGILPNRYFKHWILLVEALSIFLSVGISPLDIERGRLMLDKFINQYGDHYGLENMTFNLHSLSHVADWVENLGPLWATSTFIFESNNSSLVKLAHGTQFVPLQIARAFTVRQYLPGLYSRHVHGTDVDEHFCRITKPYLPTTSSVAIEDKFRVFGKVKIRPPRNEEALALEILLDIPVPNRIRFYKRVTYRGQLYTCRQYSKAWKRNSYTVQFVNGRFGLIEIYVIMGRTLYALYHEAKVSLHRRIGREQETGACARHINIIERRENDLSSCSVTDFHQKCIFIPSGSHRDDMCCIMPNTVELD